MSLTGVLFGRPLADGEAASERIGSLEGVAVLGLDAVASAAYGPEAALTALLVLGAGGTWLVRPISAALIAILVVVCLSYRQTIAAYPDGGGSYTVARENLGPGAGVLAAAALLLDYLLNVAVAIAAGVGALVSAAPRLLPYTLPLCLALLLLLTLVNLRGVRSAGLAFALPTWAFIASLGGTLLLGAWKVLAAHGHPLPVVAPPPLGAGAEALGLAVVLRAFANGCTAMTGVEAVSNAVPIFREPRTRAAGRTLVTIVVVLVLLLAGIAFVSQAYGIGATPPGRAGYQSVLSQLVAAVAGRGAFYHLTLASVVAVLCLSANTSFADFPRVCRLLALDGYLPPGFAHSGRRLVFTTGILVLALLSGLLLLAFGGITDALIPLFAVGALAAFTMSQAGMVVHWRRRGGPGARRALVLNAAGATATTVTLLVVIGSKFTEGAWLSVAFIALVVLLLRRTRAYNGRIAQASRSSEPLEVEGYQPPLVVVPLTTLDRQARKALRFALTISPEVQAVEVVHSDAGPSELSRLWPRLVEEPARRAGRPAPALVTVRTSYREVVDPLLAHVRALARAAPRRFLAVVIPELVERRWSTFLLHGHLAAALTVELLLRAAPQVVVVNTPWHVGPGRRRRARANAPRSLPGEASATP